MRRVVTHIEVAKSRDLAELVRLVRAYYRFDQIRFNAGKTKVGVRRLLAHPELGRVWIIRHGPRAVGYAILTFNYDIEFGGLESILTDLFVESAYRGRGLGHKTVEAVLDYCQSVGIGMIELQVGSDNAEAQSFYRNLGFEPLPRIVMAREVG